MTDDEAIAAVIERVAPLGITERHERLAAIDARSFTEAPTPLNRFWRIDFSRRDYGLSLERDLLTPTYALDEAAQQAGLRLLPVHEARDLIAGFAPRTAANTSRLWALAAAFESGGYVLHVPRSVRLENPVRIEVAIAATTLWAPRNLIIVEEGAEVHVVEAWTHVSSLVATPEPNPGGALIVGSTEVYCRAQSRVTITSLQDAPPTATVAHARTASLDDDAELNWSVAELGGGLVRSDCTVELAARGAHANLNFVAFPQGKQHLDLRSTVTHAVGATTSDTRVRMAATAAGQGRYTGNIAILAGAHGAQAALKDDALLLSPHAHIDSIPALEIAANDVQAFHGATVGALDEQSLFYIMSRGIERKAARELLTLGFFATVVDRFGDSPLRVQITNRIRERIITDDPSS